MFILQVRASFVERFSMGAPIMGGKIQGPAFNDVAEKVDWVERFVLLGTQATEAARSERERYFTPHALDGCSLLAPGLMYIVIMCLALIEFAAGKYLLSAPCCYFDHMQSRGVGVLPAWGMN